MSDVKSKIEVIKAMCPSCGSEAFQKKGKVAVDGGTNYTRDICKKGCGWVGDMILASTGKPISYPPEQKA